MNHLIMAPCILLLAGCPQQDRKAVSYVNNYLIPKDFRGWLIVREKPEGTPRPQEITYQFDQQGFCISGIRLGGNLFHTRYFYVDAAGNRQEIPSGDPPAVLGDGVHAWAFLTTPALTSDAYKGEVWDLYFVGTAKEYESAKLTYGDYLKKFDLYKTVTATRSDQ